MEETPKHIKKDFERGIIKLSDFRPRNLHPKAKTRLLIGMLGTFLVIFGCIYMLSMSTFYFDVDFTTSDGLANFFKNLVSILYIVGSILVIIILWYVMIKDCPISPAAKANYNASHDKSLKGVKIIAALAAAVANKGESDSIEYIASTIDDYFNEPQNEEENSYGEHSEYCGDEYGAPMQMQ